ncbi:hypothetical protein EDD15DRAFT_2464863 [Pisolithus albus]|nr:hypothetical protein EDD15DRAFT_2464863 [Pisolithus albus]
MSSKMQEKTYQSQWKSVSDSIMGEGAQLWTPYNGDGSASESVSAVRAFLHQSMVIDKVIRLLLHRQIQRTWKGALSFMRLAILDADLAVFRYTWIERIVQAAARLTRPTCVDHGFPSLLPPDLVQTLDEGGASRALSRLSWAIPFPRSEFREKQHMSASQHVAVLDEYARQGFKFAKRCDLLVPNVGDILGGRFTMTKLHGWMLSDDSRRIDEDCERLICDYIFVMDPATGLLVFFTCSADLSSVDDLADFSSLADVTSGLCLIPSQQVSTVRFMLKGTYNLQHCLLLYSIEDNKGFVVISHCALVSVEPRVETISIIRPLIATQHFHRDLATTIVMFWEAIQKGNSCVLPSEYPATDGFFQDIVPSLGTGPTKLPAPAGPPAYQGPGLPPPPSVHPAYAPGPGNPPPGGPIESNPGASGALAPAGSASGSQFPDDLDPHNVPPEWKKEGVDWFAVVTGRHKSMTPNQVKRHACLPMSQLLERWETSTSAVFASALMGSSRATGAEDKQIRLCYYVLAVMGIWDIAKKRICNVFDGHQQEIYSLDFSLDGRLIVSGSGDKTAWIWDMVDGSSKVLTINDPDSLNNDAGVTSVAISPNGQLVAADSLDAVVRVWDVVTGFLVSGSLDKMLKYWDVSGLLAGGSKRKDVAANGKKDLEKHSPCTMNFVGHTDYVLSVAVSHNGQWVVSGSKDRGVQFWEAHSAKCA